MTERTVDVLILGAGTAGMAAYRAALAHTPRVLLVEGKQYGTTCARVGCMPSKLLIAAAEAAHGAERAHLFGADEERRAKVDGVRVMERVRSERDRFVGFVERAVEEFSPQNRLMGQAVFEEASVVRVGEERIRARAVVVATGSRPTIPPPLRGLGDRLLLNDDVFAWTDLPRSIAVFGLGAIGLELGQALRRLGVRVKLFGVRGNVGALTDPEVLRSAASVLREELELDTDASVLGVEAREGGVAIRWREGEAERSETFEYVLATTGRLPDVEGLGLERAGLRLGPRNQIVHDATTMQTGVPHIFVAGDASGDRPLLHEAADEGRIAGDNAARYPAVRPQPRRSPLSIIFTDPQVAMVGSTFEQLAGRPFLVGSVDFSDQGRSRVMGMNRGLLRLYAEAPSGRLLGAEMIGPRAEHLAHLLAWSHQQGMTVEQMLAMPFYHPVVEEGLRTALRDAQARLQAVRLPSHPREPKERENHHDQRTAA